MLNIKLVVVVKGSRKCEMVVGEESQGRTVACSE